MANPRQRRKARSSSHRPISHSKRAKKIGKKTPAIRGPKVLQDAWDKRKTVRQNYASLGLVSNLNPLASGGMEGSVVKVNGGRERCGHGKIVRDEDGNTVGAELGEEEGGEEVVEEVAWVDPLGSSEARSRVVQGLETLSSNQSAQRRFASRGEVAYLARLVQKYGSDVESMARDRVLNGEQKTAGELRRGLEKAALSSAGE